MVLPRIRTMLSSLLLLASLNANAAINSHAMTAQNAQMVNLNMQIQSRNKTVKSDLVMPFYQTAEFERKVGDKNVLIEVITRRGKKADEVSLAMKFYKEGAGKAFYKKEILAKVNQESRVSFRGMSVKVRPVLN